MSKLLIVNTPKAAGTTLAAGDFVKITSGLAVKTTANNEAIFGVVHSTPPTNATRVSVVRRGIVKVRCLVADTDGSSGPDAAISFGTILYLGGEVSGMTATTHGAGQYAVSGAGTASYTTKQIGVCVDLTGEAGSTSADTEGEVYVDLCPGPLA